jgi:hypothetical protein
MTPGFSMPKAKCRIVAMRIPSRRTFWLSAVLLLAIIAGVWLIAPRSRITHTNFDRIQVGMNESEVRELLGTPEVGTWAGGLHSVYFYTWDWNDGPNLITVSFNDKYQVIGKRMHLATAWETLTWYAKRASKKVGTTWQ